MHDIVVLELEDHLAGGASPEFYAHLTLCAGCAGELKEMEELSGYVRALSAVAETAPLPRPGFYLQVVERIEERNRNPFLALFAPSPAFFRRIAFASLLVLVGLGSFLVTREDAAGDKDALAVISQLPVDQPEAAPVANATAEGGGHDRLLATLVNYGE